MGEHQNKSGIREEFESHLNSPFTLLTKLRNFFFGTKKPDVYTRISFFTGLIGWAIFFVWSVFGTLAISMREFIVDKKEIDVIALLENRGKELHFEPAEFLTAIENFYLVSIFLWLLVFIGLVLLWRKNFYFVWFFFSGTIGYLLTMWIMLGFSYFRTDTTFFDKVVLFALIGHTAVYAYILSQEIKGVPINLFGVDISEEQDSDR